MAVCYRHPDRETGVSCSNCGNPICPECMTSTQVGMRCPDCSSEKTRVVRPRGTGGSAEAPLTYILIALNVLVMLGAQFGGSAQVSEWGVLYGPFVQEGQVWRLVTGGFLHAGLMHLAFNMLALWVLGSLLEPVMGTMRFGILYFVSLLGGAFGALLLSPHSPTVGASGAVFGLMGGAFVIMRNRGFNPLESGLALWMGLNLLITFVVPGISIGGHLGGLAGGVLAALAMYEVGDRMRQPLAGVALALGVGVLAVAGSLAIV